MSAQTISVSVGTAWAALSPHPAKQVRVSNPSAATIRVRAGASAFSVPIEAGSQKTFPVQVTLAEYQLRRDQAGSAVDVTVTFGDSVEGVPDVIEPGAGGAVSSDLLAITAWADLAAVEITADDITNHIIRRYYDEAADEMRTVRLKAKTTETDVTDEVAVSTSLATGVWVVVRSL